MAWLTVRFQADRTTVCNVRKYNTLRRSDPQNIHCSKSNCWSLNLRIGERTKPTRDHRGTIVLLRTVIVFPMDYNARFQSSQEGSTAFYPLYASLSSPLLCCRFLWTQNNMDYNDPQKNSRELDISVYTQNNSYLERSVSSEYAPFFWTEQSTWDQTEDHGASRCLPGP